MVNYNYTFRLVQLLCILTNNIFIAFAVFSRSPSAYHALRGPGILNLPCAKTIRGYMNQHSSSHGIHDDLIQESSSKYEEHIAKLGKKGHARPLKEGILIWDETKVLFFHYISSMQVNLM